MDASSFSPSSASLGPVHAAASGDAASADRGAVHGAALDSQDVTIQDVTIEGYAQPIALRVYRPARPETERAAGAELPVLLYFHGGGFVRGSLGEPDADAAARYFARHLPALVVSVGYSLAPRFPFPAAPEDAYRAACWIKRHAAAFGADARRILSAGHDAGGQIANALAFIGRDRGGVAVEAQALFAPMLDPSLTRVGDAQRLGSDITPSDCAACYRAYLPEARQRMHPYAAPIESMRLAGLPHTLIVTAQNDVLHVEAEKYAGRLIEAGVRTNVVRYPSVSHAELAGHTAALQEAVRFFHCCFAARRG